ncbi:hypothetical protein [Nannocystis punicea]|uniref:Uncharacterized protein n=1 Tax=Nannocystis punicea TaxID=2995304 RepID=A0ABY7GTH2_9BACT|nr:hypothetical protein [Nannocystis poenicansa]WAS90214.1 hypothetical protein O0S08_28805 [Nannocystis poenicansa]
MTRKLKIFGTLVLLAALGVGVALWVRHEAVNEQRAASAREAASRGTQATLTAEDACWLAIDFYHSGRGLAGRAPLVECSGELVAVPGGYKLTRVLTASEFMSGQMGHDLCIGRGQTWAVLGEAYQLDDCRSLPVGSADPAADAARHVRGLVAEDVARARAAVKTALAQPPPPETCASAAPADGTAHLDGRRLEPGASIPPWTSVIPHDAAFELCVDPDSADPQADFACKQRRPWTHVIVTQVQQIEPPRRHPDTKEFSGGQAVGELWLVDVAAARALCRRPFAAKMPELVLEASVETTFQDAVRRAVEEAELGLRAGAQ